MRVETLGDLFAKTEKELLKVRGFKLVFLVEVRARLRLRGYNLKKG
jgi:DNA-directed RNA polymerase alpha subunit